MDSKQRAAHAALDHIASGMVVGLGTGSTADFFLTALAAAIHAGKLHGIRGIPTSKRSERRAIELKIPLTTLDEYHACDVTVDGADEVAPNLDLIKGLGGALLREKIVAQNSKKLVIIADQGKVVTHLTQRSPLPVEVIQFGSETQEPFLRSLGAEPVLRMAAGDMVFVTDNGNFIYDCRFPAGMQNPLQFQAALMDRAGIVESGLFLGLATIALIGSDSGVREMKRA